MSQHSIGLPVMKDKIDETEVRKSLLDLLGAVNDEAGTLSDLVTSFATSQGGIYASGSNANGNYLKLIDGTLIQWGTATTGTLSITLNFNIGTYGWSTYEGGVSITFPVAFVDTSFIFVPTQGDTNNNAVFARLQGRTTTGGSIIVEGVATTACKVDWIAIGKWSTASGFSPAGTPPTTSIYASASTATGGYIQFTDGTMQVWGKYDWGSRAAASEFFATVTIAASFVDTNFYPTSGGVFCGSGGGGVNTLVQVINSANSITLYLKTHTGVVQSYVTTYSCVGRWK